MTGKACLPATTAWKLAPPLPPTTPLCHWPAEHALPLLSQPECPAEFCQRVRPSVHVAYFDGLRMLLSNT